MSWALSASFAAHLLMVGGTPSGAIRTAVPVPARMLEARLERAEDGDRPHEVAHAEKRAPDAVRPSRLPEQGKPGRLLPIEAQRDAQQITDATDSSTQDSRQSASVSVDPVYYSARDLDIYPVPLAPLRIEYPAHLANARIGGGVLVNLLVDEAGTVDRVTVLAGEPPGYFDERARATLASVRFAPGRRDGRPVKSQLTVRVNFDSASPADANR